LDDTEWPERLVARAVEPAIDDDRLHGYAVLADVAAHYRYSDLVYLAIVGELPNERASLQFHVAACSFATPAVTEAPTHVGVLSRICGGTIGAAIAGAAVCVADQARALLDGHVALLSWLADPTESIPSDFCTDEQSHAAWVATLRNATPSELVRPTMTRDAARIALLYDAGLHDRERIEAAIVVSRMNGVIAEAILAGPQDLDKYPVKLPPFHYIEVP
jgi:hypothetical protein